MYWKRSRDVIRVSRDGESELFSFDAGEFAEITSATAWPGGDDVTVTAAKQDVDRADVMANRRGKYRAFRISRSGVEQLTDEYTSTAVPLPNNEGLAYSNGSSLVVLRAGQRVAHRVGRFNWGPVSISCSDDGRRVAMNKWKGDCSKVAYADQGAAQIVVTRFSHDSYLLVRDVILYCTGADLRSFDPSTGVSRTLVPRPERRRLLGSIGWSDAEDDVVRLDFSSLSLFDGMPVVCIHAYRFGAALSRWQGLVRLPASDRGLEIVRSIDEPWRIRGVRSVNDTIRLDLERIENLELAETAVEVLGRRAESVRSGWHPLDWPRVPNLGFQFLPRSAP
ncbi:MAG: hypothetical protein HMLKMBBP_00159 [Planctomycetes bacterium]|nr:hypothetical protein [Planctomycetota bacterium]